MESKEKLFKSKQIPESKESSVPKSKSPKAVAKEVETELRKVSIDNNEELSGIARLSSSLQQVLNPENLAIPEEGITANHKEVQVKNNDMLKIFGKDKTKEAIEDILTQQLEDKANSLAMYTHTGVYAKILQCRKNDFIEQNLPITSKSLDLFVDDVCNGVFRGSEYGSHNKFRFWDNGAEVKDLNRIKQMVEIINPTSYTELMQDIKTFDSINFESYRLNRKHGYENLRIISHKTVCKEMYIKYVLKEKKKAVLKKSVTKDYEKTKVATPSSKNAVESINNFLKSNNVKTRITLNDDVFGKLGLDLAIQIPSHLLIEGEIYKGQIGTESVMMDNFSYNEYSTDETFVEFMERYYNGKLNKIYNINTELKPDINSIKGECFTFEIGGLSDQASAAILQELQFLENTSSDIGTESMKIAVESFNGGSDYDPAIDTMLKSVGFDEIYNTGYDSIANYNGIGVGNHMKFGTESMNNVSVLDEVFRTKARSGNAADQLFLEAFRSLDKIPTIAMEVNNEMTGTIAQEDLYSADNTLNPSFGRVELGSKNDGSPDVRVDNTNNIEKAAELVQEKKIDYGRLEKMFSGIKGETTEHLKHDRMIPLSAGNKLIGVIYIEYTHQDITHLIGIRSIIGNPITFTQNIDMLNIRTDEQEETIGRMVFTDTIKPLVQRNMSTKFIKNNASIIYCMKKLMEENDISQSMSFNDMTRFNMYNLSRIIFIPASQLIFRRNGSSGLGDSVFTRALVPATARIIANEAYLSWLFCDGKGASFVVIPQGLSAVGNENGLAGLKEQIDSKMMVSRAKMRDIAFNNTPVTHRIFTMVRDEDASEGDIDIKTLEYPAFNIDNEMMKTWEQEATSIIGYSSALFSSTDGNVELAKKIFEIDQSKMLDIIRARKEMKIPASQLATKLLHMRGGETYHSVTVEWLEPPIERDNNVKRSEVLDELSKTLDSTLAIYDALNENNEQYKDAKDYIAKVILEEIADEDKLITGMDDIIAQGIRLFNVSVTAEISEQDLDKEKEKENKKNNEEPEEEGGNE